MGKNSTRIRANTELGENGEGTTYKVRKNTKTERKRDVLKLQ